MSDPLYAKRCEQGLMLILRKACGACENSTSGIGSCYRNQRTAEATYGADQVCDACIAHRALFGRSDEAL